ncbi:competence type IV pilus minor pilin ComGF [Enterococcus sp. AZ109]|uniref:competence type IV pilus minor pilin ComGF n=1 Tax=Enterococcus sp. AZ109 TaxID=2774634 RepID=UPI003F1FF0B3
MNGKMKRENQGFTLLECLVALLILSGSILLLQGLIKHVAKTEQQLSAYHSREWEVGMLQLENELKGLNYISTEVLRINLQTSSGEDVKIEKVNSTVRKSYKGGHQPLFTQVYSFTCRKVGHTVELNLKFNDGTKKKGIWVIE